MEKKKTIQEAIEWLKTDESIKDQIVHWHTIPEKEAKTAPFPKTLHPLLKEGLQKRGIDRLYTHQLAAYEKARNGESFVVVTPTASGKTLCYNLPVS